MSIDEKIKNQKELVSLEILTFENEDVSEKSEKELKELYSKFKEEFALIDDLSQPYVIRTVVGERAKIRALEPEMIPSEDRFEVIESIQEILKERNIPIYKSEFDNTQIENISRIKEQQLNNAIKSEMIKGLKQLQTSKSSDIIDAVGISDRVKIDIKNDNVLEQPNQISPKE